MVTKEHWQGFWYGVALMFILVIILSLLTYIIKPKQCDCIVMIGNQSLTIENAFEYVTKGLSAHQYLEVQQAINNSCECCK